MRCLIINMDRATDRLAFMERQMTVLGLDWERIAAVIPETLAPPADDAVWHRWQRPLRVTEMALCASHMAAWTRVVELDAPCLILEDDALLAADLVARLDALAPLTGIDHVSLETRSRRKLIARTPHPAAPIRRLYQDRTGSAAMVVWPSGARKLLRQARRVGAPSDALISSCPGLVSYQSDPALSIQLDQCVAYGVTQATETHSLIDAANKPSLADLPASKRLAFRARRIWGQLVMGVRLLVFRPVSRYRHVVPVEQWAVDAE